MKPAVKPKTGKASLIAASVAVCCCTLMATATQAAGDPGNNPPPKKEGRERDFRDSRWADNRDSRAYAARAEEQRRIMEDNSSNAEMSRRMGRMSADERRDLRRQINEAGQEVYALPPKR